MDRWARNLYRLSCAPQDELWLRFMIFLTFYPAPPSGQSVNLSNTLFMTTYLPNYQQLINLHMLTHQTKTVNIVTIIAYYYALPQRQQTLGNLLFKQGTFSQSLFCLFSPHSQNFFLPVWGLKCPFLILRPIAALIRKGNKRDLHRMCKWRLISSCWPWHLESVKLWTSQFNCSI